MANLLYNATLCVPGARKRDSASNSARDLGPGSWVAVRAVSITGLSPLGDPVARIGGNGLRRFLAERREAGPVVDIDQHRTVGTGQRDVAAEHFESQQRGRVERQRL